MTQISLCTAYDDRTGKLAFYFSEIFIQLHAHALWHSTKNKHKRKTMISHYHLNTEVNKYNLQGQSVSVVITIVVWEHKNYFNIYYVFV